MRESSAPTRWTRHLIYRTERTRTTWKLRLGLVAVIVVATWLTADWWTTAIAQSLICEPSGGASDAILIENFDPDYLMFERARNLRQTGLTSRVLVPVRTDPSTGELSTVSLGIAEVMTRISRLGSVEFVPIRQVEPISLNAAFDVLRFLTQERIGSVTIVSPLFRSRRSALVYQQTLGKAGISVYCEPVQGTVGPKNWTRTWHGIQDVAQQWIKLQYYRLYVLPFRIPDDPAR